VGHIKLWDSILECPKIHKLSDRTFRAWTKTLVTALRNGGRNGELPSRYDLAFRLRLSEQEVDECIIEMHQAGLLDSCPNNNIGGMPYKIHDWDEWQLPKDKTAAARQAKWRENQALRNAHRNGLRNELPIPLVTIEITDKKEEGKKEEENPPTPLGGVVVEASSLGPEYRDVGEFAINLSGDLSWGSWVTRQGQAGFAAAWIREAVLTASGNGKLAKAYALTILRGYPSSGPPSLSPNGSGFHKPDPEAAKKADRAAKDAEIAKRAASESAEIIAKLKAQGKYREPKT